MDHSELLTEHLLRYKFEDEPTAVMTKDFYFHFPFANDVFHGLESRVTTRKATNQSIIPFIIPIVY